MNSSNDHSKKILAGRRQNGVALLILVLIISLATISTLYSKITVNSIKIEKEKKTIEALKAAKEALIAYSLNSDYLNPSSACLSNTNCPRPGDLPCPDSNNDGIMESSCGNAAGNNQARRLNRLPWKTLGLEDLRDGYGERLWYAVSNNYKYNTRTRPLNSDTVGTITVRDSSGRVIYDATTGGGVVAVIIAPGQAIQRQDGVIQDRSTAQENISTNYLDNISSEEDNSDFTDSGSNGFIIGPIKDSNGNEILNDRLIVITRDEMAAAMEAYVLTQVRDALSTYYAANSFYPNPALFTDSTCIATTAVNISVGCKVDTSTSHGRIPVTNADGITATWTATSILRGLRAGNWFQQNLWRELIHYAVAPACSTGTTGCTGSGYLTLNGSSDKQVVVISAGRTLAGQSRSTKLSESDYLEGEDLSPSPPDNIYIRSAQTNSSFNDRAMSIP
jgi:type II secretory pathway pseudopilin PulG